MTCTAGSVLPNTWSCMVLPTSCLENPPPCPQALDYLHCRQRVVHGDLKPENALMGASGRIALSDFGCRQVWLKARLVCGCVGADTEVFGWAPAAVLHCCPTLAAGEAAAMSQLLVGL